jgi:hypothetical protein
LFQHDKLSKIFQKSFLRLNNKLREAFKNKLKREILAYLSFCSCLLFLY